MSKKKSYRAETVVVDEAIPEEVKEEDIETVEEPVLMGPIVVEEEVEPKKPVYTIKQVGEVIPWTLNVRERPSVDSDVVKVLRFKDEVEILDENTAKDWLPVLLTDGTKGYCMSKFIREIK